MKKILVTGGLGFIGSRFITLALENKYKIINLDSCTYAANTSLMGTQHNYSFGSISNKFSSFYAGYYFKHGDITNKFNLDLVFDSTADVVINFAASTHVDNSIQNSDDFIDTNIRGVHNLLEKCRQYKIPFYHISTDEALQHKKPLFGKFFKRLKENALYEPNNPYSASKTAAEMLVKAWIKTYNIDAKIIRLTNNYGPFQHKEKLIPKIISKALNNEKIPIYGKGLQFRDFLFVDDSARAIMSIIERGKKNIYHISANDERKNIDTVKYILKKMNKPDNLIEFVEDRPAHDFSYSLDHSLITRELGWKPEISFEEGIENTIKFYAST